jgi:hypothetical protein
VTRAFGAALIKPDEKSSVRIGGTFDRFDYDNVARVGGGTVINDDRDRDMTTIGMRAGRQSSVGGSVFTISVCYRTATQNRNSRVENEQTILPGGCYC